MIKKNLKIVSIVLTWNSESSIKSCLDSLNESTIKSEILVVDNDSVDNTREIVAKNYPNVRLINTTANLGYSGGNNVGIAKAITQHAEFVFILNPDAKVDNQCLCKLLLRLQDEDKLAGVSPKIYHNGGKNIYFAGSSILWHNGVTTQPGGEDTGQFDGNRYTDRLSGCAMLIRVDAIKKVGLMDERFFLYYEETDWSVRFREAGFKLGLVPEAIVWHSTSSSTGGFISPLYTYYITRNKLLFVRKHRPLMLPIVLFFIIYDSTMRIKLTYERTNKKTAFLVSKAIAKAYYDFFTGKYGKRNIPS